MDKPFILIAEDDADDRYLLRAAFKEKGFKEKIEFVENGIDLLNFLHAAQSSGDTETAYPGFVMLDLNMPKKDGREVLREIKQHPEFRKIPVIIFTTTKNENEIRRCYQLGANSYIVKPVSFDGLLKVVEDIRSYWFNTVSIPG